LTYNIKIGNSHNPEEETMRALLNTLHQNGFGVIGIVGLLAALLTIVSPLPLLPHAVGAGFILIAVWGAEFFRKNPMVLYRGDSQSWFWLRMSLMGILGGYFIGSALKAFWLFGLLPLFS
jgi:hypothetical protein